VHALERELEEMERNGVPAQEQLARMEMTLAEASHQATVSAGSSAAAVQVRTPLSKSWGKGNITKGALDTRWSLSRHYHPPLAPSAGSSFRF
jgi:hypothetical protein